MLHIIGATVNFQDVTVQGGSTAVDGVGILAKPVDGNGDGTAECDTGAVELQGPIFVDSFESEPDPLKIASTYGISAPGPIGAPYNSFL